MTDSLWQRARELFSELLDLAPEEREARLDAACANDPALRAEVSELLALHEDAPRDFLAANRANELPAGFRVGSFELVEELGRGAMGVVYRARQPSLDREVAVKVFGRNLTTRDFEVERFRREARSAARLTHEHVVRVLADGEERELCWFAMELVRGHDLSTEIARHAERSERVTYLPRRGQAGHTKAIATLVRDVADALQHAHEQGIVHRDIKPSNLLLDEQGSVQVTDFGIARNEGMGTLTQTEQWLGSLPYMSPEQARLLEQRVDHRTDVYSLGVVLYELLTWQRPIRGSTSHEIITNLRTHQPIPVRRLNQDVPRDLGVICGKAMSKAPDERYASAAALRDDLDRFLNHEAIQAQPPTWRQRFTRHLRRRRVAWITGSLVAASVFATAFVVTSHTQRVASERAVSSLARLAREEVWDGHDVTELALARRTARTLLRDAALTTSDRHVLEGLLKRIEDHAASRSERARALMEDGLRGVTSQPVEANYRAIVDGLTQLQELAPLRAHPDEASIARDAFQPRVTLHATDEAGDPLAGQVFLRTLDPLTTVPGPRVRVGVLPLAEVAFPIGSLRIEVELANEAIHEFTRHLAIGAVETIACESGQRARSQADMVRIEGGTLRLRDEGFRLNPVNGLDVPIAPFWLDETEVSVADFREFLRAHPDVPAPVCVRATTPGSPADQLPVTDVTWEQARAYAEWHGKRLPHLAEWFLAARGENGAAWGSGGRATSHLDQARWQGSSGSDDDLMNHYLQCASPVRSHRDVPERGLYHMFGNAAEWTESHATQFFETERRPVFEDRLLAGPWWYASPNITGRSVQKRSASRSGAWIAYGFRCARSIAR
ncbi:MAG: protein kinase [Planctomycetes bacterium]|nr:protein kinase [Planctomycetota bacterium]